jgi:uncharacterized damage-inducible protein DinB
MYSYNTWANHRIFEMAAQLSPEEFTAPMDMDGNSIRNILVHLLSAQNVWLGRMQDGSTPSPLEPLEFSTVALLYQRWTAIDGITQGFLDTLDEATLAATRTYINFKGEQNTYPIWQMLYHQANHAMQHRSELALLLTQLGHSPGLLDFLIYIDQSHDTPEKTQIEPQRRKER